MSYRLLSILAFSAISVFAQDNVRIDARFVDSPSFVGAGGIRAVPGAPFSADEVTDDVQTLADGTHITHTFTRKVYRDSAGRTRMERPMGRPGTDGADAPTIIEISDPVAHVRYLFTTADKIVHKQSLGGSLAPSQPGGTGARPRRTEPSPDFNRAQRTVENLGSDTMEGLPVEGRRFTTTWPAGSLMGNDGPIAIVNESWLSPELHLEVLSKTIDPRSGEHTQKLTNISRDEPDPSLFQPPADYTVTQDGPGGVH